MSAAPSRTSFTKKPPASEEILKSIFDSSDDAIVSKDLNGIVTSWNGSAERIFGYTAGEMVGRTIAVILPPDHIGEEDEILSKVRAGVRMDHFETVRRRKDGTLADVMVSISPVRSATGAIVGASTIARDTSETKRPVRADLLLSAIVNSSEDAIISKSLDGIITSWNPGAERIFGYTAAEIVGQSVLNLIPLDRRDEEPRILERLRRGERVDHFETVRVRKGGAHFHVSLTISPVKNAQGEISGASKIARDITELKAIAAEREKLLESERTARAQAEHANRMKDDFLATVSHELRTPLNAIVGWTDVLAEGGADRAEVVYGIDVIRKNATMQAQLIDDLLDLGCITSGKMVLHIEPVDISIILREATASVQHAADAKGIVLKTAIGGLRDGLMGDAKRLQQVLWNLLVNAIKFTDQGGLIVVNAVQLGSMIEISVADNGKGIAPLSLPRLFDRFWQADTSTTRKQGGLGIGLALVKQLAELHGGFVRAESGGLGQGARFTLSLPVAATPKPVSSPAKSEPPLLADLSEVKVLAVDDDRDSVDVVRRILGGRHAEVRTASSVTGAFEVLRTFSPDVILSDISMAGQDGYEFVRQLRDHSFFAGIPAVALTALARVEDRTRALNAGFQTHIAKPVVASELVAVVRSMANLHSARNAEAAALRC